jgi:hypothetical protein
LRVKLINRTLPNWAAWMLRVPALQCRAAITFHNIDDETDIFGRTMEGRWTNIPEPIPIGFVTDSNNRRVALIPAEYHGVDVYPGDSEYLDIAMRADGDEECYGWSNESYFCTPLWRNPKWKLDRGRYLVKVIVTSSGQKIARWFRIENNADRSAFRLETYSRRVAGN